MGIIIDVDIGNKELSMQMMQKKTCIMHFKQKAAVSNPKNVHAA